MNIHRNLEEIVPPPNGSVVTIGNFDGVHLGHREIFRRVIARAGELGAVSSVVTFVPHPLKLLAPQQAPRLLNTYAEKERLIAASCVEQLVCIPFDREMADMPAAEFVAGVLVARLATRHLVIGYDYAFGKGREGDSRFLANQGKRYGFTLEVLEPVIRDGQVNSSTLIRRRLAEGDVSGVVALLGRHFTLEGTVTHGAGRGVRLGFPTANLLTDKEILPRPGVYAVKVRQGDGFRDGVMNIGFNPTFGLERISLEVHILDFSGDLYNQSLRVYFIERLRDEMVFASAEDLAKQIAADISRARELLQKCQVVEYREYLDCGYRI